MTCCDYSYYDENQKVLTLIRILAPDLNDVTDDVVEVMINLARPHIWKERFGKFYYEALAYLVAHRIKLHQMVAEVGSESGSVVGGAITSEHEGDLSRSYGSAGSSGKGYTDTFGKTVYGLEFKKIRDMCVVGVCTRFG